MLQEFISSFNEYSLHALFFSIFCAFSDIVILCLLEYYCTRTELSSWNCQLPSTLIASPPGFFYFTLLSDFRVHPPYLHTQQLPFHGPWLVSHQALFPLFSVTSVILAHISYCPTSWVHLLQQLKSLWSPRTVSSTYHHSYLSLDTQPSSKLENVSLSFFSPWDLVVLWWDSTALPGSQIRLYIFTRISFPSFFSPVLCFVILWKLPVLRHALLCFSSDSFLIWLQNLQDYSNTQIFPPLLKAFCTIIFSFFAIFSPLIHEEWQ